MKRRSLLIGVAALAVLSACSKLDTPSEPVWGKEPCAHCAMIVGDKRYAGQIAEDGDRRYFDDIGCMVLWAQAHEAHPTRRVWARDAEGSGWLDAKSATYAAGARTPMDFGFEARTGGALGWNEVRDRVIAKNKKGGER